MRPLSRFWLSTVAWSKLSEDWSLLSCGLNFQRLFGALRLTINQVVEISLTSDHDLTDYTQLQYDIIFFYFIGALFQPFSGVIIFARCDFWSILVNSEKRSIQLSHNQINLILKNEYGCVLSISFITFKDLNISLSFRDK